MFDLIYLKNGIDVINYDRMLSVSYLFEIILQIEIGKFTFHKKKMSTELIKLQSSQ